ncbi:MAG: 2-hydroxyglutaryl-CoA dehydratase [Chloroflexi bacterium]|nr:2-hydroxyglutaryl-CoA dehydratase [Chloroflexota bacterium]
MIVSGCDVGSLSAEAVIMNDNSIVSSSIIRVRPRPEQSAKEAMDMALSEAGLPLENIDYCVSTGYGRDRIPFANSNVSEISCHGRGAHWIDSNLRTVIDIGGQDCKAIRVDGMGYIENFAMNDKCAAGTGRFLEIMARTLGVELSELGPLALESKAPVNVVKICSVFTQFEVVCMLNEGKDKADIAAGIAAAMAERLNLIIRKVGVKKDVAVTGGVAKNVAVVDSLQEVLGVELLQFREIDPQIIGALGAAVIAKERLQRSSQRS